MPRRLFAACCPGLLALGLLLPGAVTAAPLRAIIMQSWTLPLADIPRGQPEQGLIPDLYRLISREAGVELQLTVVPRARIDMTLQQGKADLLCYSSPEWMQAPYRFIWSLPFMTQRNLLVGRQHYADFKGLTELQGEPVGMVLGYSYAELQPLIEAGRLQRQDARSQQLALEMLRAKRFDYAVSNDLSLRWFNHLNPEQQPLVELELIREEPVACLVRDDPALPSMRLLRSMVRLQQRGEFERLLQRYR